MSETAEKLVSDEREEEAGGGDGNNNHHLAMIRSVRSTISLLHIEWEFLLRNWAAIAVQLSLENYQIDKQFSLIHYFFPVDQRIESKTERKYGEAAGASMRSLRKQNK